MKNKEKIQREADRYVDPNETKLQKLKRYLGYYKIPIIAVLCLAIVISVMTVTFVTKEDVDLYVFFVCDDEYGFLSDPVEFIDYFSKMQNMLEEYADDYNGDGEIKVGIDTIYVSSEDIFFQETVEANKQRINGALSAGTCMCVIGDTAGFEYLSATEMLQDITYLVDGTYFNGKAYRLNDSELAVATLGLNGTEPLYIGLRSYYGTFAEMQKKPTAYFTMGEKLIKILSDPDFDPETDTIPEPVA